MSETSFNLELVPPRGENELEQNEILVPLKSYFSNFPTITPVTFIWESPGIYKPLGNLYLIDNYSQMSEKGC